MIVIDREAQPLLRKELDPIKYVIREQTKKRSYCSFLAFVAITALNRACDNVVVAYYTSLLGSSGSLGLGLLFFTQAFVSLFFSKAIIASIGCRRAIISSHFGFAKFCLLFYWAYKLSDDASEQKQHLIWIASVIGGASVALWWPAQNEYYSSTIDSIAQSTSRTDYADTQESISIRSDLATIWTSLYLAIDVGMKISGTLTVYYYDIDDFLVVVNVIVIFTAVLSVLTIQEIPSSAKQRSDQEEVRTVSAACRHVADTSRFYLQSSLMLLLSTYFIAYGVCQAMLAYYVDGTVITYQENLGTIWIGALSAVSTCVAATLSPLFNWITTRFASGIHFLVLLACLCYIASACMVLLLSDDMLSKWAAIIAYKAMWGFVRGVYENSFKVLMSNLFNAKTRTMAFSIQIMMVGIFCGLFLFVFPFISRSSMALLCLATGIIAFGSYLLAQRFMQTCQ